MAAIADRSGLRLHVGAALAFGTTVSIKVPDAMLRAGTKTSPGRVPPTTWFGFSAMSTVLAATIRPSAVTVNVLIELFVP